MRHISILDDQDKLNNFAMPPGHYIAQVKLSQK